MNDKTIDPVKPKPKKEMVMFNFLWMFIVPMVFNKGLFVMFAMRYTKEPGRGYGYAAFAFFMLFVVTMIVFLWKFRNYDDSE